VFIGQECVIWLPFAAQWLGTYVFGFFNPTSVCKEMVLRMAAMFSSQQCQMNFLSHHIALISCIM
jgi:hypothetical protein